MESEQVDPQVFRLLSYGLYVVASKLGKGKNGQIVNTVFQVTAEPPQVAVSINKKNLTHDYIIKSGIFSISILDEATPLPFIRQLGFKSGHKADKLNNIGHVMGLKDCPIVTEHALGFLEVKLVNQVDVGTHTIFVGKVMRGKILRTGTPLTYATYQQVRGGKAPKTAPTYLPSVPKTAPTFIPPTSEPQEVSTASKENQQYQCEVCGWIYDPTKGDPEQGIAPGTPFHALPEDWVCPVCGASKTEFAPI